MINQNSKENEERNIKLQEIKNNLLNNPKLSSNKVEEIAEIILDHPKANRLFLQDLDAEQLTQFKIYLDNKDILEERCSKELIDKLVDGSFNGAQMYLLINGIMNGNIPSKDILAKILDPKIPYVKMNYIISIINTTNYSSNNISSIARYYLDNMHKFNIDQLYEIYNALSHDINIKDNIIYTSANVTAKCMALATYLEISDIDYSISILDSGSVNIVISGEVL